MMAVNGFTLDNNTCSNFDEDEQLLTKKVRRKLYAGCQDCSLNGSVELIPQFEDFGPRLIRIRMNDQIRELQTILRDPYVIRFCYDYIASNTNFLMCLLSYIHILHYHDNLV
jgi:hypothetical protein